MSLLASSDFWADHRHVMTAQLPTYDTTLQAILGKYHVEEESFSAWQAQREIVALSTPRGGQQIYCSAHFYVRAPRHYATMVAAPSLGDDTASAMPLGYVAGTYVDGYDEVELGRAQAWYYPVDRLWVLWECYFTHQWRAGLWIDDENMLALWRHVERYLREVRPDATQIVTPPHHAVANPRTDDGYQTMLRALGYSAYDARAWGKALA